MGLGPGNWPFLRDVNRRFADIALEPTDPFRELPHDASLKQCLEPETLDRNAIDRLSRCFNTHMVMYFYNGHQGYDNHPLIRDEVERIVSAHTPLDPGTPSRPDNKTPA